MRNGFSWELLKNILNPLIRGGLENRSPICEAMRMDRKRTRYGLLCFFGFTSLFLLGANTGEVLKQDSAWKRYHNQHWGYCVSYPSRWLKGDAFEGAGIFVETGVKKHSKPLGAIDVGALANPDAGLEDAAGLTLIQDLQLHLDGLKKFERAEDLEVFDKREMQLFGSSALFTKDRYFDPQDRAKWVDEIVLANRKGALYRLELECRADQLTRFEPVFLHVLSTFQFDCVEDR